MKRTGVFVMIMVLIGLWAALWGGTVQAQDTTASTETPTPTKALPLIERASAEPLFPAGMRFTLFLNVMPEAVHSIQLQVSSESGFTQKVRLFFARDAFSYAAQKTMFTALMKIMPDDPNFPAPFSELTYTWTVRAHDGRMITESRTAILQDLRWESAYPPRWTQTGAAPITLYSHNPNLALSYLLVESSRAHARISADLGPQPDYRIVLYDAGSRFCKQLADGTVYIDSAEIGGVSMPCDPQSAITYYRTHGFTLVRRSDALLPSTAREIVSLIAGEALDRLWVGQSSAPRWLREGLIRLYASTTRAAELALVREMLERDQLLSLSVLQGQPPEQIESAARWGAQAYLLTLYVADQYGANTPFEAARWIGSGGTWADFVAQNLKTDPERLFRDWRTWVITTRADQAVRWTPYQETTPTPTPTATAYPSPTATSSEPTPTRTLIPSQTPQPFRPAPTFTPIPSNTPLPPGSLNRTLTPEDGDESDGGGEGDNGRGGIQTPYGAAADTPTILLVGGLLLVVVAAAVVVLTVRRRR